MKRKAKAAAKKKQPTKKQKKTDVDGADAQGDTGDTSGGANDETQPLVTLCDDILFDILPYLDNTTLLAVRATSRRFVKPADELLARHVVLQRLHRKMYAAGDDVAPLVSLRTPSSVLPSFKPRAYPTTTPRQPIPNISLDGERPFPKRKVYPKGALDRALKKLGDRNRPGWSAQFVLRKSQWKKFEAARLRLAKIEMEIFEEAYMDREDAYEACLEDFYENEERIEQMLNPAKIIDIIGFSVDHSILAPLMPNLEYVRLVDDQGDCRYHGQGQWRYTDGRRQEVSSLAAPTYVVSPNVGFHPPSETRRVIF